jgi:transcriptional regulator with XRE-family HTH domain
MKLAKSASVCKYANDDQPAANEFRGRLSWCQSDVAGHSGISKPTIARLESTDGELGGRGETVRKIRAALEASGIEFIEENGTGEGVRFRKPRRSRRM